MVLLCGTIPDDAFPLTLGEVSFHEQTLAIDTAEIPCTQGTGAMISAACVVSSFLGNEPPRALLAGDNGSGRGSRKLYEYLIKNVAALSPAVVVLHYMLPVMGLMRRVCAAAEKCSPKPVLIADASAMYAAKAAGLAPGFDVFTPDFSELGFLADPEATHPAYMGRHLFEADMRQAPELIAAAYRNGSAAKMLFIKGSVDYIAEEGMIIASIDEPDVPALEAIGGTGDTISGMIGALAHARFPLLSAATVAARANRMAGKYAGATPATRIGRIIAELPAVLRDHLQAWQEKENLDA